MTRLTVQTHHFYDHFLGENGLVASALFFLHLFQKKIFEDSWHSFFDRPPALPVT